MLHARLFAESRNHLRNLGPVVVQHGVLEGGVDQIAFGQRVGARHFKNAIEVMDRIEVGGHRASHHHGCGNTQREANRHAGKTQLHSDQEPSFRILAHGVGIVNP